MATIGQIDPAGTASVRGIAPGTAIPGLRDEDQDEFNRGADIERAEQRNATLNARAGAGEDQGAVAVQTGGAANVNQVNAAGTNNDNTEQRSEVRNDLAGQDQQLPTPFDPNRGTQLDIAV
jgi:hypothetical protein